MPQEATRQIIQTRFETPLGPMIAWAVEEGLCLLEFTDRAILESEFNALTKHYNATVTDGTHPVLDMLQVQLTEYFEGRRKEFTVPLDVPGTPFQQQVWAELQRIPFGITRSYKQQAIAVNNLPAIRAVAQANGMNRIAILIPCHRVIGENGKLTGYGGGLWRKQRLLDLERQNRQGELF